MPDEQNQPCPKCKSSRTLYLALETAWICGNCNHRWTVTADATESDSPPVKLKIFLSYGHEPPEHVEVALRIKADLEKRNHEVWFDIEKLRAGVDWEAYIEEGLQWCDKVLLLMSPYSVRRRDRNDPNSRDGYCLNELAKAIELNRSLVPVMLAWVENGPPASISRIQWLDMTDCVPLPAQQERYETRFPRLLHALEYDDLDFEGGQVRLRRLLRPLDFAPEVSRHIARFTGREWLFKELDHWLEFEPNSRVFWIVAGPGVGKTAIAAKLAHRREVVAMHFCVHGHDDKANPVRAVLSIAYQLGQHLPAYNNLLKDLDIEDEVSKNAGTLFENLVVSPLARPDFPRPDGHVLVVIDALDEATKGTDNEIAAFIAQYWSQTPPWLRLVITSRTEPEILQRLRSSALEPFVLDAESEENLADLRDYLRAGLDRLEMFAAEDVIDAIVRKSEGVFLYAEIVLEELAQGGLALTNLDAFPKGLTEIYLRFFKRRFPEEEAYCRDIAPLVSATIAQRDPLPLDLLARAMGITRAALDQRMLRLGSLFPTRAGSAQEPPTVTPCHKSVAEWLTERDDYTGLPVAGFYAADLEAGRKQLADACWSAYRERPEDCPAYVPAHLPAHLLAAGRREELKDLLFDYVFIRGKIRAFGPRSLIEDYNLLNPGRNQPLGLVRGAIMLSAHVLAWDPAQLPSQLHGRLLEFEIPEIQRLLNQATELTTGMWFRPQRGSLTPPGGPLVRTFEGHTGPVLAVTIVDSGRALSASWDTTLKAWDVETGECLRTLEGHTDTVWGVTMTPSGHALSGSSDNTLKLWDVETGECLRTLAGHTGGVLAVTITPSGRALSASSDKTLKVWNMETGECLRTLEGHSDEVSEVTMTPSGRAVSASGDNTLKVWDVETGECLRTLEGYTGKVAMTPSGHAVCASRGNTLKVLDVETGKCLRTLEGHTGGVLAVTMTPSGRALSVSSDKTLKVWDVESGECLRTLEDITGVVWAVTMTPSGCALSASLDSKLKLWDVETGGCLRRLAGHTDAVWGVTMTPSSRVVSASSDKTLKVWDMETGECLRTLAGHTDAVWGVTMTPSSRVVSASSDKTLKVWDMETGECLRTLAGHTGAVRGVTMTPSGRALSVSSDKTLKVWDVETGECLCTLAGHSDAVRGVTMTPSGHAVSASSDKTLKVWDVETGECLRTLEGHSDTVGGVTMTPSGHAVSASWDKTLKVWDVESGKCLRTLEGHGDEVSAVTMTLSGHALSASVEKLRLWDVETGACLRTLAGHTATVVAVTMTPSGHAVSASHDGRLKLWDVQNGACLMTFSTDEAVFACATSPDGRTLVAGGHGPVQFLHMQGMDVRGSERLR